MKLNLLFIATIISLSAFTQNEIKWKTFEEAVEDNKTNAKLFFIDVYTDWCGWCKRMDASTFQDSVMIKFLNDNFHCVKVNAEDKKDVVFNGDTLTFIDNYGRNGVHELAARLLDGKMGYPAFVVLNKELQRVEILKGYQSTSVLGPKLEKLWRSNQ